MNEARILKLAEMIKEKEALSRRIQITIGKAPKRRTYTKRKKSNGHSNGSAKKKQQVLQGRYMGSVRALSPAHRKEVSKIREAKGYHAAIKAAKGFKEASA